jgi:hypothetical protein
LVVRPFSHEAAALRFVNAAILYNDPEPEAAGVTCDGTLYM